VDTVQHESSSGETGGDEIMPALALDLGLDFLKLSVSSQPDLRSNFLELSASAISSAFVLSVLS
jgi:hypothetical protein